MIEKHDRVWHDHGRSGSRNLRRAGEEDEAMMITGHKTPRVFQRHNVVNEDDLRGAMKATPEYVASQPTIVETA